ncbi:hypothetical protein T190_28880 [Sinorhizobium meliloti CCBAU 01290]|nr:hypothetical protein T190_28880 [Sinorhizobium meliloti CCBAU 01290]
MRTLAKARGDQLATFDRKLSAAAVTRGKFCLAPDHRK